MTHYTVEQLNRLDSSAFESDIGSCCGAKRWINGMTEARPFRDKSQLLDAAERVADSLGEVDWVEAFSHHPKIGDVSSLQKKFAATAAWATLEQGGTAAASLDVLKELQELNLEYERRHGFIFIVFATGKSAVEMLVLLKSRIANSRITEVRLAAKEQRKITKLRLEKLLGEVL